jgi:hypothetical protein
MRGSPVSSSVALVGFVDFFVREPVGFAAVLVTARFPGLDLALDFDSEFAGSTTFLGTFSSSTLASGGAFDLGGLPLRFEVAFGAASSR